jgi:hypothetical protein
MADTGTAKRQRKKLFSFATEAATLVVQYVSVELASFNAFASVCNILDRFMLLTPSIATPGGAHELFGTVACFDNMPEALLDKLLSDLTRQRARVSGYTDSLQALRDRIQLISSEAMQLAISMQHIEVSKRSIDEPHSAFDLATYCDIWAACIAADVVHKISTLSMLPSLTDLRTVAVAMTVQEATELVRCAENCAKSWVCYRARDEDFASMGVLELAGANGGGYLQEMWAEASFAMWKLRGKAIGQDDSLLKTVAMALN